MYNYIFFVISFLSCFWTVVKKDCSSWGIFLSFFAPIHLTVRSVAGYLLVPGYNLYMND